MSTLLAFAPLLAAQKGRLARALLLSLATLVAGIALLGVSGWFLTAAALSTAGVAFNIFAPSAAVRGLAFARILSRYGEKVEGHEATLRLLSQLRAAVFARLFAAIPLPGIGLSRPDLVNRLVADVDALDTVLLTAIGPVTTAVCVGIAMTLGLAALLPGAALGYGLCFFAAALVVPAMLVAASRRVGTARTAASAALRQAVLDGLDAHRELVVFGQGMTALDRLASTAKGLAAAQRRLGRAGAAGTAAIQVLAGTAAALVLIGGIGALADGRIDGPLLAGLLFAVIASFEATAPLLRGATRLTSAAAAAERLEAISTLTSPIRGPENPVPIPADATLELNKLRFGYGGQGEVLKDLSLTIPQGARIAITGPSGGGKSSLAQLLVRLADPNSGCIRLGGVELGQLSLADLRRDIALMMQDAPVFNDTVRNNLLIGRPDADDDALWRALDAVLLGSLVRGLPQQLDAVVGEAGATLSAGQARRLALARTLLSPARILVLDEPTSGLDRDTERAVFENLALAAAGRTLILITHASPPEESVDSTCRLLDGRLVPEPGLRH